jgi:hypothetical protein
MKSTRSLTRKTQRKLLTAQPSSTCLNKTTSPEVLVKIHEALSRHSSILFGLCSFVSFALRFFICVCYPSFTFASQPYLSVSRISDAIHSNTPPKPNWRRISHALNLALESDTVNARAQEGGNASPAMNEISAGTRIKDRYVAVKVRASIRVNLESFSNEIDDNGLQCEKHSEQRI